MAKKRASANSGINMSAEIRDVLTVNPDYSARQCLDAVSAKFPGASINEKSFQVAFSNARKKLGLTKKGKRRVVRKRKPAAARQTTAAPAPKLDLSQLQAAREFVSKVGGAKTAIAAIEKLTSLQLP